jgi:F-type H+-transporting ATPase subunit epsilon
MAENTEFELVSPEQLLLSEPVEMVVVPGTEGDFGVLPGHAPMISAVRTGVISIWRDGTVDRRIFVAGGFAEVTPERCTVLADEAVALETADRGAAQERISDAEDDLAHADTDPERESAQAALEIATSLLSAIDSAAK